MDGLYDTLVQYSGKDYYPMHMPGHKRNTKLLPMVNPYSIDITEIEGFDNLHQPEGILKELADSLAKLYGAGRSFPLVNGSTAGILGGIAAATGRGDRVIVARNCHKAVYHAILLNGLEPVYLYPELIPGTSVNGGISASQVEEMLIAYPGIRAVIITSPTYEGIVSDIKSIAKAVHKAGALLLVDEAHGAHFGFHSAFPQSAVALDADIVIQSLHKTLPAFTQTAVLHSNRPELNDRIGQFLSIYQSSSPSYLLMAGIERCIRFLEAYSGELFEELHKNLECFFRRLESLKKIRLLHCPPSGSGSVFRKDPSKLILQVGGTSLTGPELSRRLREEYHIVMEMDSKDYVLGMTSICDTWEGFSRLEEALVAIDGELRGKKEPESSPIDCRPVKALQPYEAAELETEEIHMTKGCGRIAAGFIGIYPPGIPLLVPGEIIEERLLQVIKRALEDGLTVTGLLGKEKDRIGVIRKG